MAPALSPLAKLPLLLPGTLGPREDMGAQLAGTVSHDVLLLSALVLAVAALAGVWNVIGTRRLARDAARAARRHSDTLRDLLRSVRMAESIAGIGVWQYDYASQTQLWSDGLKRLFGFEPDCEMVEGDAETLLYASNIDLVGKVREHADQMHVFTLQFDIFDFDGLPRSIEVKACNLRNGEGAVQRVVAVVRDISEQVERDNAAAREWRLAHEIAPASSGALLKHDGDADGSGIDPLTGLLDRRRIMSELDRKVMTARFAHSPLVLVMFDIDQLQRINTSLGRGAGDAALKRVARLAREFARDIDVVGRVGGAAFAWIIPGVTDGMARIMIERLRQGISCDSPAGARPQVTISVGLAGVQGGDTALALFSRADEALRDAKQSGRNRVRVAA